MTTPQCITSKSHVIYRIVNFQNGKVYVGQAINYDRRVHEHFYDLQHNKHYNPHLQAAYNQYGKDAFFSEILETNILKENLDEREQYWIAHFDSYKNGYNRTSGGNSCRKYSKYCEWNGIQYQSIREAAHASNMSFRSMQFRRNRGYTSDKDMVDGRINQQICTWNGVMYKSITAAAKANGINHTTMLERLSRGYSCDADMSGHHKNHIKECIWNGIVYKSRTDCAEAIGVSKVTLYRYLKNGWTSDLDLDNKWKRRVK